jgi:hypothetical protein
MGRGYSYLIASGPNHRIYWFLFKKLTSRVYGIDKIPRYTEAERDELAAAHADDALNKQLRFGELYANRTTATLQALPEVVFSKWHYGRVITIGDAAHKVCSTNTSMLLVSSFNKVFSSVLLEDKEATAPSKTLQY